VAGGYCEGEYYAPQPPIVWDAQVASAALTHAQDMAAHSFLDTLGSDGSTPKERVVKAGYDPTDVVELWMGGIDDPSVRDDWLFEDWPCRYLSSPGVAAGAVADTTGVYRRNGELVSANFHYTVVTLSGSCAEADGGALRYVHGILRESYLWYDQVPRRLNYANYTDADELLSYNRYAALDRWSYITDAESYDNLFQAGRYVGYGFGAGRDAAGHMRIRFVYRDSPAQRAGLRRGDRIVEVNGSTAEEIDAGNLWGTIYGDAELGLAATLAVQDGDGQTREVSMVKAWVEINTVLDARVHLLDDGRRVGYLVFQSFLETAPAQLEAAFAEFAAAGVDELVLDLRYNGGGRLDVAALLAGLIGGEITAGKTFAKLRHNTKYSAYDQSVAFSGGPDGLNLNRVVVITTQDSCSASEAVINGLRPYLDVVTVGTATCGKPVGMYGYNYCDKHLAPIEFEVVNAAGEGGYHEGIAATCAAGDELGLPLGDAGEASLRAALAFLRDGQCTLTPAGIAPSAKRPLLHAGFRREVGAD
jgi:carboxyl-terminal processing protease